MEKMKKISSKELDIEIQLYYFLSNIVIWGLCYSISGVSNSSRLYMIRFSLKKKHFAINDKGCS